MSRAIDTTKNSKMTLVCMGLIITAIVAYLYFLNMSVVHVVMRKEATQEKNYLRTEIASLETAYIEAQHTITARMATLDETNNSARKVFITRGDSSLVVRGN